MKYWYSLEWDDSFNHEGLLFFVQKMQEMLFHFSDDIHRAPIHNTSTLADEFIKVSSEVEQGKINKNQLKVIFEEFKYSFVHDKILKDNLSVKFIEQVDKKMRSCQECEYLDIVNYLEAIIAPNYLEWTIKYLKGHIAHGNHKQEIVAGARCWIAEITMSGYSAEYVYSYLDNLLIRTPVHSLEILDTFFSRFDFKKRGYKVYFYIKDKLVAYSKMLSKRLTLQFEDDGNFNKIKSVRGFTICYFEIEAPDYYTAVVWAYQKINVFLKYYSFLSDQRSCLINRMGYVLDIEKSEMHSLPIIPTGLKANKMYESDSVAHTSDYIIMGLQGHDSKSFNILNKAIELHNSALRQQLPKDALANLWSALEVLCPNCGKESKLDAVLASSMSILQNDYFQAVFISIYDDMKSNMEDEERSSLLAKISGDDEVYKTAAFCLLPEYEDLRDEYFKKWGNYPLLRDKIFNIYQLRNDKGALFELSNCYAQRVGWHLSRLYRARNAIVHSGKTYNRIQLLSEHLHSYVDSIMSEIAFKLSEEKALSDINSVFVDTQFLLNSKKNHFKNSNAVTAEDIDFLLKAYFIES